MNPRDLVKNARIVDSIDSADIENIDTYLNSSDSNGGYKHIEGGYPLPIIPSPLDLRVTAQHSRFTLHKSAGGIENRFAPGSFDKRGYWSVLKVHIPGKQRIKIHRDLRLFGTTAMDIMPGVDTLASEINDRMTFGMKDLDHAGV